MGLAIYYKII
ncbi:uncharacterized protein FTOL_13846 [Fusarium torulosum]|uniref:Uncharacterized protein n=1 Tax=Fusarium torulosum TaxID=33205 RepID=A0AAE8SQL1_9HYPO|nr:uncharacterized protein FTOL_13846 [Fusarium torulosum]